MIMILATGTRDAVEDMGIKKAALTYVYILMLLGSRTFSRLFIMPHITFVESNCSGV